MKNNLIVVQKNELVQNTIYKNLSISDLKLFKLLISKIDNNTTLFEDFYYISYDELDLIDFPSKNRYSLIVESLKRLAGFYVHISSSKEDKYIGLILNNFIFKRHSRQIVISLHNDLLEYLLQLKMKFTMYELSNIRNLSNKYELKLYEYLKSFHNHSTHVDISIKTLRTVLELSDDEYVLFGSLKQRILTPSLKKINENTDLFVVPKFIRENKKIIKVRFIHGGKR